MRFLQEGNFNGLIFRDGMVFISDIDRWVTKEEYEKYKNIDKSYEQRYNKSAKTIISN